MQAGVPDGIGPEVQRRSSRQNDEFSGVVVRPARLERATFWFVARRSIQLSYGRVFSATYVRQPELLSRLAMGHETASMFSMPTSLRLTHRME